MGDCVRFRRHSTLVRIAAAGLLASVAGGCNSSQRFAENPLSNLFKSDPVSTGALPAPEQSAAIEQRSLSAPSSRVSNAPLAPAPARTAVVPAAVTGGATGWTAEGGTAITVAEGDTVQSLSNRYGVPPAAILSANNYKNGTQFPAGSRIVVPVYSAGGRSSAAATRTAAAPQPKFKLVEGAQPAAKSRDTKSAKKDDDKAKPTRQEAKAVEAKAKVADATAEAPAKPAPKAPEKVASLAPEPETASVAADKLDATGFRWPARGRVIAGFGAKGGNEGINIAVPEGTPVKAAEGGTVAYSGSELKGYGNLVLVRHENGWVSAYANNGELLVKRGEKVKRGQTIAKSGQTGNVSSPQLHFELRKGATPVDPMPHLAGG